MRPSGPPVWMPAVVGIQAAVMVLALWANTTPTPLTSFVGVAAISCWVAVALTAIIATVRCVGYALTTVASFMHDSDSGPDPFRRGEVDDGPERDSR